jgi:hypothetical protein|tara:strand:+ start:390 stop:512 length:123 start_codon:yes stop_codon:yes gene_type:complete
MFGYESLSAVAFFLFENLSRKTDVNPHPLGLGIVGFQDFH